jgi:hypothetical protein
MFLLVFFLRNIGGERAPMALDVEEQTNSVGQNSPFHLHHDEGEN